MASEPAQTDATESDVRLHYLTVETTALVVDGEGYVVVNDTAVLANHTLIEFYVGLPVWLKMCAINKRHKLA